LSDDGGLPKRLRPASLDPQAEGIPSQREKVASRKTRPEGVRDGRLIRTPRLDAWSAACYLLLGDPGAMRASRRRQDTTHGEPSALLVATSATVAAELAGEPATAPLAAQKGEKRVPT
jgi:hypothetical protein